MGESCLREHTKICTIPIDSQYRCTNDQFCFCLCCRLVQLSFVIPSMHNISVNTFYMKYICGILGSAPLTAVQLLWVNMIMDTLGALALATEPPTDELMKRPPIGRHANFISKAMWRNILGHSVYQFTVLAVLNFDGERLLGLTGSDSQAVLDTVIFNSFVFCQVSFCFYPPLFSFNLYRNCILWLPGFLLLVY